MPPSASATPPTQTTQRVPKRSSKPIDRDGAGERGGGGGTADGAAVTAGIDVAAAKAGCGGAGVSSCFNGGAGSAAGARCTGAGEAGSGKAADLGTTPLRSSARSLVSRLRVMRSAAFALISPITAITGVHRIANATATSRPTIGAHLRPHRTLSLSCDRRKLQLNHVH